MVPCATLFMQHMVTGGESAIWLRGPGEATAADLGYSRHRCCFGAQPLISCDSYARGRSPVPLRLRCQLEHDFTGRVVYEGAPAAPKVQKEARRLPRLHVGQNCGAGQFSWETLLVAGAIRSISCCAATCDRLTWGICAWPCRADAAHRPVHQQRLTHANSAGTAAKISADSVAR